MGTIGTGARGRRGGRWALAALLPGLLALTVQGSASAADHGPVDLRLILSAPSTAIAGNALTYDASIHNFGVNTADNVTLTLTLPLPLVFFSSSQLCTTAATSVTVSNKELTSNVVTLTTAAPHLLVAGQSITVALSPADPVFDGTFTITSTPTPTTLTYAKTNADVASAASGGTITTSNTTVTCNLGNVGPGNDAHVSIHAGIVGTTANAGSVFVNAKAAVSSDASSDTDPSDNVDAAATLITAQADLSIASVASPAVSTGTGQDITFSITVTNQGPSYARAVRFNDTTVGFPDGPSGDPMFQIVTVLDDPARTDSCTITPGFGSITHSSNIDCTLIDANPGGGGPTDSLEPQGNWANPAPSPNNGRWKITVVARAVRPGTLTSTLQVTSQDTAPNPLPGTPDPNLANNLFTQTLNIDPVVDLQAFAVFGAEVQTNNLPGDVIDTNAITPMPEPSCCNFGGTTVTAGRRIQWDTTTINAGTADAHNVRIEVSLPFGTSLIENTLTGFPNFSPGNAQGRCTTEAAGQLRTKVICVYDVLQGTGHPTPGVGDPPLVTSASLRFLVLVDPSVPQGTQLSFDTHSSSDEPDSKLSNNDTGIQFDSNAWADLDIVKTGLGPNPWVSGEERTVRYDVKNKGPSLARDVIVSDALPDGVEFVAAYLGGDQGQGGIPLACTVTTENDMECKLGDLAPSDGVKKLYVHVHIAANVPDGTTLASDGVTSSDTRDPVDGPGTNDNVDPESKTVTIQADLAVNITTESDFFPLPTLVVLGPGDIAEQLLEEFTITTTNNGPSDAQKVLTTVNLPPLAVGKYVFDDGGCTLIDLVLSCPQGTIAAGASKTFHVMFHINDDVLFVTLTANVGIDEDLDGVPDGLDLCDGTPAGTAVDAFGCPTPDADGDRVIDSADACPLTPAGTTVDTTGCPAPDADADGVRDAIDLCPATPPATLVNLVGCPDADQDGVKDADDACPGTAPFTSVTLIGCPLDPDLTNNTFTKTIVDADGELPETGADTRWMMSLAICFLIGGVGLVGLDRRRLRWLRR